MKKSIIDTQLAFFQSGKSGCLFAAVAAQEPERYGWKHVVSSECASQLDHLVAQAIECEHTSTLSIVLPTVHTNAQLHQFMDELQQCKLIYLEQEIVDQDVVCLGFRAQVGDLQSWIAGFGPFEFFAKTRQAPYTELTIRVKPRPNYEKVMKESPQHIIHLADMNMIGMEDKVFKHIWHTTFKNTEQILGHKPTIRNAAKTTFVLSVDKQLEVI